jgi:hypothetical protein
LGQAGELYKPGDPKLAAYLKTVRETAVWVNERNGFALYVPGFTADGIDGAPRYLSFVDYDEAERRGLEALREQAAQLQLPSTPMEFIPNVMP